MTAKHYKQMALAWFDGIFFGSIVLLALVWIFTEVSLQLGEFTFALTWRARLVLWLPSIVLVRLLVSGFKIRGGLWGNRAYWKLFMAVFMPVAMLVGAEQVLKALRYDPPFAPIVFQKGDVLSAQEDRILPDRSELLWKMTPNSTYQGKPINSLGIMDREIPRKTANERRIFCFGDSVTAQGQPPYTSYMQALLAPYSSPTQDWQVYNFGVPGYSSRQGFFFFHRVGRHLQPDIITFWYGWNDHWLFEKTDAQRMAIPLSPLRGRLHNLLLQKRLGKLLLNLSNPSLRVRTTDSDLTFRVPPEEYDEVLTRFIRETRSIGAQPILITAPRRRIHDRIVTTGHALSPEAAGEAHDLYNDVMRNVAAREGAPLLDMAGIMSGPEFDEFFEADGIHFDRYFLEERTPEAITEQPGLQFIAKTLTDFIIALDATPDRIYPNP